VAAQATASRSSLCLFRNLISILMPTRRVRIVVPVIQLLLEFALLSRLGGVLRRGGMLRCSRQNLLAKPFQSSRAVASAATTDPTFT
jgi:hypothetical protein